MNWSMPPDLPGGVVLGALSRLSLDPWIGILCSEEGMPPLGL
jgi:hypothetical protein